MPTPSNLQIHPDVAVGDFAAGKNLEQTGVLRGVVETMGALYDPPSGGVKKYGSEREGADAESQGNFGGGKPTQGGTGGAPGAKTPPGAVAVPAPADARNTLTRPQAEAALGALTKQGGAVGPVAQSCDKKLTALAESLLGQAKASDDARAGRQSPSGWTRAAGALRMAGGTLAVAGGAAWIYGTGGWGAWLGGGYLVARGLDNMRTGGLEAWDGQPHETAPQALGNAVGGKGVGEQAEHAASILEIWGLYRAALAAAARAAAEQSAKVAAEEAAKEAGQLAKEPAKVKLPPEASRAQTGIGIRTVGDAPNQVQPGVRVLEGIHLDDLGRQHPWRAHYDEFGRLIARTDWDPRNLPGIPPVHHHTYEWTRGGRIKTGAHIPGEYIP